MVRQDKQSGEQRHHVEIDDSTIIPTSQKNRVETRKQTHDAQGGSG
jgi:hypothetical protein